jgi:hypothetical protein
VTEEEDTRRVELVMVQQHADLGRLVETASAVPGVRSATVAP